MSKELMLIILAVLFIITVGYAAKQIESGNAKAKQIAELQKQISSDKALMQALEAERLKYKNDYESLVKKLSVITEKKKNLVPPTTDIEIKQRFEKLGYKPK